MSRCSHVVSVSSSTLLVMKQLSLSTLLTVQCSMGASSASTGTMASSHIGNSAVDVPEAKSETRFEPMLSKLTRVGVADRARTLR